MLLASANVDLEAGAQFDTLARATAAYQVLPFSFAFMIRLLFGLNDMA